MVLWFIALLHVPWQKNLQEYDSSLLHCAAWKKLVSLEQKAFQKELISLEQKVYLNPLLPASDGLAIIDAEPILVCPKANAIEGLCSIRLAMAPYIRCSREKHVHWKALHHSEYPSFGLSFWTACENLNHIMRDCKVWIYYYKIVGSRCLSILY